MFDRTICFFDEAQPRVHSQEGQNDLARFLLLQSGSAADGGAAGRLASDLAPVPGRVVPAGHVHRRRAEATDEHRLL